MNKEKHENALVGTIMHFIHPLTHHTSTLVNVERKNTFLIILFVFDLCVRRKCVKQREREREKKIF